MGYNIGMISLGCAKNRTDAELMLGILAEGGHRLVADPESADIIIVNTCGFIESAKQESIDTILEMAEYKKGRCRALIATGCLAERYSGEIMEEIPELDGIAGVGDYHKIKEVIEAVTAGDKPALFGHINDDPPEGLPRVLSTPSYTAYLKIAEGCDNNCTYCAIPKIRGRFRSRRMEDILAEARELCASGVKELIVIAQDTTRYGKDIYGEYKLAELLGALAQTPGLEWLRVHYFYTEAVTDELIRVMAENDKICKYVDMPIQHISNDILRRMARRTNREQIIQTIEKLRAAMPEVVIRTSIIAGFPGETQEQFDELYEFVRDIRFDRMGVFAYSQEENTAAAEFDGQIDEDVKQERLDRLMSLQQKISLEKNRAKLNKVIDVITEGFDDESCLYYGRSTGDSIGVDGCVYYGAEKELCAGDIVKVRILDCDEYDLSGMCE